MKIIGRFILAHPRFVEISPVLPINSSIAFASRENGDKRRACQYLIGL
jgi:hypothetical protein